MMKTNEFLDKLKWYVIYHDFNNDKIESFNIFHSSNFRDGVEKELKKYTDFESFKKEIKNWLMYSFWSKSEYEIICSGLFEKSEQYKIDIYYQVLPNLDILANYIIDEYNKTKRKKLEK